VVAVERTHLLSPDAELSGSSLSFPGVRVVVLRGPDRGRAARLDREELSIGTAPTAALCLTDPTVSRHHALLRLTARGLVLTDSGSTNGTRVDGRVIQSVHVSPGDTIELGATRLRIEALRQRLNLPLHAEHRFGPLLGESVSARRLFALLDQVAPTDLSVLLLGESGVGKDLAAQALHEASPRADRPFIVFDCGATAPGVIESELFGHEKGAFTGAIDRRLGAFQEADGGTLFIDEVGELPRELQPKLLRALDRREVRPVGSDKTIAVDVRVIAATNRDLKLEVNRGAFREDLFYRLSVFPIVVPPLRERLEDLPLLADHFWRAFTKDPGAGVPDDLVPDLVAHHWPGNIRELRHRVEQLAVLRDRDRGPLGDAGEPSPAPHSYREGRARALASFEIAFLRDVMARANGNVSEAARLATMDRVYLSKLLRKHRVLKR
jgi:transcriptional regulator with GAF, ATPase, and Fis domain